MKTIARQTQGERYYFIQLSVLAARATNDLYFPSDDEKHAAGNYFLSADCCKRCAAELQERFGEELQTIANKRQQYRDRLLHAIEEISDKRHFAKIGREKGQPDLTDVVEGAKEIAIKLAEFNADTRVLSNRAAEIRTEVEQIVTNYPKI